MLAETDSDRGSAHGMVFKVFKGWQRSVDKPATSQRGRRRLMLQDPDTVIYAIGDVHGCHRELQQAEERIFADAARHPSITIVMLGDYVDRGPKSADVIEHLIAPTPAGVRRICLAGNHDDEMHRFLAGHDKGSEWLDFGGRLTLRSYGVDASASSTRSEAETLRSLAASVVPRSHLRFLAEMPVLLVAGRFIFVHAGLAPGRPLNQQTDHDLMWIREPFLSLGPGFDVTVVHGHTPSSRPTIGPNRIGIDTAAYASGNLTVLKIDGKDLSFI